jgi:uncharacterized Zn-finger protein
MTPDLIATAVTGDDEPGDDTVASASLSMNPPPRKPLPLRSRVNIPPPFILQSSTTGPLTQRSSLSSASAEIFDKQLVNDHNHVGPGFDMQARPFVCEYMDCDKAFARKSDLSRHFKIHTNDRYVVSSF